MIAACDRKYGWSYDVATYGPLPRIGPEVVLAWRAAGWAGRDSVRQTGPGAWAVDPELIHP